MSSIAEIENIQELADLIVTFYLELLFSLYCSMPLTTRRIRIYDILPLNLTLCNETE